MLNKLSALKKRIFTAIILIPIIVAMVLYLPVKWFALCLGVIFLLALWEWTALSGFKTRQKRCIALVAMMLISFLIIYGLQYFTQEKFLFYQQVEEHAGKLSYSPLLQRFLQGVFIGGWLSALIIVINFPRGSRLYRSKIFGLLAGVFVLLPAFFSLLALKTVSALLVIYILVLIWAADIGAYFVGKRFGRHPLAPHVSAGKTWEGVLGGLLASLLVSIAGFYLFGIQIALWLWVLINVITVIFSIIGDLFESVFKRLQHLKDSGQLLPGHGGILDRIDSLTAAFPIFTMILMSFA